LATDPFLERFDGGCGFDAAFAGASTGTDSQLIADNGSWASDDVAIPKTKRIKAALRLVCIQSDRHNQFLGAGG
jgi:hypothetical protein